MHRGSFQNVYHSSWLASKASSSSCSVATTSSFTYKIPISSNKFRNVCEPCQLVKSHRLPFTCTHVSSSQPFDLMYSNVWGPSPNFSMKGNRYFVLFVDDCTKFIWIYFFYLINLKISIPLLKLVP